MTSKIQPNKYVFNTELEGFVRLGIPGGKFNNCSFHFRLPSDVMAAAEKDREELLAWAKTKVSGRVSTNVEKWDEEGLVKYNYGGDATNPDPVIVDSEGQPLPLEVIKTIRKGTKVRLIVQQTPYTKPNMGTTLKVRGIQVIELVSGYSTDSGDLDPEDIANEFGTVDGFKVGSPAPRPVGVAEDDEEGLDF